MLEKLRANIRVHLRFYRRNRLLAGIAILFIAIALIYVGGSLLFGTATGRFELTRDLFAELTQFAFLFIAIVGIVLVSVDVRGRAVKLVFTKPCPPEVWLASAFSSAIALAVVLYAAILGTVAILSAVWAIPFQTGFVYVSVEMLFQSVIVMGYMTFLSLVMHPIIAIIIAIVFNEGIFFTIRTGLIAAIKSTGGNVLLPVLEKFTYLLYLVTPMFDPYDEQSSAVKSAMRVPDGYWHYLLFTAAYAITVTALFYLLGAVSLRRKNFV